MPKRCTWLNENLHVREQNPKLRTYNLSNILLIASQPASSSPLSLFAFGVLPSDMTFERFSAGEAFLVLSSWIKLTPLSTRTGCIGLAVAEVVNSAEEGLGGVAGLTVLAAAGILFSEDVTEIFIEGFAWSTIVAGVAVGIASARVARVCRSTWSSLSALAKFAVAGRSLLDGVATEKGLFCSNEALIVDTAVLGGDEGIVGSIVVCCLLEARSRKAEAAPSRGLVFAGTVCFASMLVEDEDMTL